MCVVMHLFFMQTVGSTTFMYRLEDSLIKEVCMDAIHMTAPRRRGRKRLNVMMSGVGFETLGLMGKPRDSMPNWGSWGRLGQKEIERWYVERGVWLEW